MSTFVVGGAQCRNCEHYKWLSSSPILKCCHCILDTGKRRKVEGKKCLSRTPKAPKPEKSTNIG